jgi:hypothetical protein
MVVLLVIVEGLQPLRLVGNKNVVLLITKPETTVFENYIYTNVQEKNVETLNISGINICYY